MFTVIDHLVGGEEQLVLGAVQHALLQGVATAGQHLEAPAADVERIAVLDAPVGAGHAGGDAQVQMAALEQSLGGHFIEAMAAVERPPTAGPEVGRGVLQRQAEQVFGARHPQFEVVVARQPAGQADMVGMEMGDDRSIAARRRWRGR